MRTTIDLPEDLVREAKEVFHVRTKRAAVVKALRVSLARRHLEEVKALAGRVRFDMSAREMRLRSERKYGAD